jgi:hypothetical protein
MSINYLFDGTQVLYILQFTKGDLAFDTNKLVGCTKSVIARQRLEDEGDLDVQELDNTPVILFQTNLETLKSNIEALASPNAAPASIDACNLIAESGPREVLSRVLPLYVQNVVRTEELKYKGTVMRFDENNTASLYQGEPQVAREMEMLVTLFFPEMNPKK